MQPAVSVQGLVRRYGARTVVDDLSFDVRAGSVLCLLGRNGAGKTTTIECLEGFRRPDAGTVRILGHDPHRDRAAVVEKMGVMLQEGGAYQAATVTEMLQLYAALHPRPMPIEEVLDSVDLTELAGSRFRTLSGGEKQRVNLALALIGNPEVLFLDEPTSGMDPAARRRTWRTVEGLRDQGVTVLLTTHAMDEAQRLADQVAIIDRGRLLALDTPAALAGTASLEDAFLALIGEEA